MSGSEANDSIIQAIEALASACDHAQARDAIGFSKATAGPGHEIAALGPHRWDATLWTYAGRIAALHSKQLLRTGKIDETQFEALRALPGGSAKAPYIASNWIDMATIDGQDWIIASTHAKSFLSRQLSRLPATDAYRPAGAGRLWRFKPAYAFLLETQLEKMDVLHAAIPDVVSRSMAAASDEMRLLAHDGPIVELNDNGSRLKFVTAFDARIHALFKAHPAGSWIKGETWLNCTFEIDLEVDGAETLIEELLSLEGISFAAHPSAKETLDRYAPRAATP